VIYFTLLPMGSDVVMLFFTMNSEVACYYDMVLGVQYDEVDDYTLQRIPNGYLIQC